VPKHRTAAAGGVAVAAAAAAAAAVAYDVDREQRISCLGRLHQHTNLQQIQHRSVVLLLQAENIKSYITTTGPIMSELLAVVALRNQQHLVGRCVGIIQDNLAAAADFFDR
jgi:hypothetical protein